MLEIVKQAILKLNARGLLNWMPDKFFLKIIFRVRIGRKLNIKKAYTYNEKLQWLKLYDRNPLYCTLVDKYEVKKYIEKEVGERYVIPTIGVWDKFEDIDFDSLPNQFVLKCTHDSGGLVICYNKQEFDKEAAKIKINRCLNKNFYWHGREWPYKSVVPRIIAEKFITKDGTAPNDYKFFCFNGKVKCFKIDFDRFTEHRANYYSPDGELLPFGETVCLPNPDKQLKMPDSLNEMIRIAELLADGRPFVRVDFYEMDGQIYFGEITFYPASGFVPLVPDEWDAILGSWITLPQKR